ncbi:ABC transporter permease [Hyphobacterium sp. CCMP332]|nr:ABC transporter permease [Hyphobacterium sp. CCMP332]
MDKKISVKRRGTNLLRDSWIWKLAWKDAKKHFDRLFLFIVSVSVGIGALVAINSFNYNLKNDIDRQAKELLAADLVIYSNQPFDTLFINMVDTFEREKGKSARMASMAIFPKNNKTRLVQLVALEGGYPFYGLVETIPRKSLEKLKSGQGALIDETLALQLEVEIGDSVKTGSLTLPIIGLVSSIPGSAGIMSSLSPSVYIPYAFLDSTNLIQYGSRVNYRLYFKAEKGENAEELFGPIKKTTKSLGYGNETVDDRKERVGSALDNMYRFFQLLGFIALILGCIGVASSVHIYVQEKIPSVAVLRCMGATGWQSFWIFFIQASGIGAIGSIIGVLLGNLVQFAIPYVLQDFIPIELNLNFSPQASFTGLGIGLIISLLFAALPLIRVKYVSPLAVLRTSAAELMKSPLLQKILFLLILVLPWVFAVYQTGELIFGTAFYAIMLITIAALAAVSYLLIRLIRKNFPKNWSFVWRQGLANLFRPNNQTSVLTIVIGLGAFMIVTLSLIQNSLLSQLEFSGDKSRSNLILVDIQDYQKDDLLAYVEKNNYPINQMVPVVTIRIDSINGKSSDEIRKDTTDEIPNWALTMEYRVTYRDSLIDSEEIVEGHYINEFKPGDDSLYVSVSERMLKRIDAQIGDEVVWDVQGVPVKSYIGSVRKVDWQRFQTNFTVLFPKGIFEDAPQFYVLLTRAENKMESSQIQKDIVRAFPNVSVLDLSMILRNVDDILSKVSFVIRFMALFSVVTGLIVLAGAVTNGKFVRLKENVLLRTLGASKNQIVQISLVEYAYLGLLSGITGSILALGASFALSIYFFEMVFVPDILSILVIWGSITALCVLIGWLNTRGIFDRSPLEVLRRDV